MPAWAIAVVSIGGVLLLLIFIVLIRTMLFRPKKRAKDEEKPASIDKEKAVTSLQALIRCKTISTSDHKDEDKNEFVKLKETLRTTYPLVFKNCEYQELGPKELLFHLKGKNGDEKHPAIFMAHFDVVSVEPDRWTEDPFAGVRKNGVLYGRGTIDTKGTLNGTLRGCEELLLHGERPEHDFYFAFAGDEEVAGGSAKLAVKYFKDHSIDP